MGSDASRANPIKKARVLSEAGRVFACAAGKLKPALQKTTTHEATALCRACIFPQALWLTRKP